MLTLILAVTLAVVVSFLCSVAEAALYSISWSKIESMRKNRDRAGETLFALRQDVDRPITAILTLNTVAHTVGAAMAGAAAADVLGYDRLWIFSLVFTLVVLIFSEILPKTIGVVYARPLAPLMAAPLAWLVRLTYPLLWLLGLIVHFIRTKKRGPQTTEDDILAMVSLTRKAGLLKPYEELSIRNILTLDLKTVNEVQTPRTVVFSLPAEMTVGEAMASGTVWPHSRIPVYEGEDREDIVGVVYRREVLGALAEDRHGLALSALMKPVEFVLETLTLDRLLIKFLESRTHLFVVLDEFGGMSGVVSLEDVLEEILGKEIVDETDEVVDMRELARQRRQSLVRKRRDEKG